MSDEILKQSLADTTGELYRDGVVTAMGGNVSVRSLEHERALWITPSAIFKGALSPNDMTLIDFEGNVLAGDYPPSIEFGFHVGLMQARPDIDAVVHSHPPYAITWGLGDVEIPPIIYDALIIRTFPYIPWMMIGSRELAAEVVSKVGKAEIKGAFLRNHGLITVGKNLRHAADLTMMTEHTLKTLHLAYQIGIKPHELDSRAMEQLNRLAATRS